MKSIAYAIAGSTLMAIAMFGQGPMTFAAAVNGGIFLTALWFRSEP